MGTAKVRNAVMAMGAVALVSGWSGPRPAAGPPSADPSAKAITIHQEIDFKAPPQRLHEALLDAKQFRAFSKRPAEIDRAAGGAFSVFSGHIVGRNLEVVPNRRIVQAWRVATWPEGAFSIARFELAAKGSGTYLVFDHTGFPEGLRDHLAEGWELNYWAPLKEYLNEAAERRSSPPESATAEVRSTGRAKT